MAHHKVTYLDYQATTPVADEVLDAMLPYFTKNFGNPHSTQHEIGLHSAAAVENAREKVSKLVNCEPDEIIFTSGATESNNFAIKSIAENYFSTKPQIVTARTEHKCVIESCHYLEKKGYDVKYLNVNQDGLINLEELEQLIKIKPSLVSIMHTNNEIGVVQPIEQIALMCDVYNSVYHCDAAQTFAWTSLDVTKNAIHAASISGHKFYPVKNTAKGVSMVILSIQGQERFKVLFCLEKFLFRHRRRSGLLLLLKTAGSTIFTLRLTVINLFWGIFTRGKWSPFSRRSMRLSSISDRDATVSCI